MFHIGLSISEISTAALPWPHEYETNLSDDLSSHCAIQSCSDGCGRSQRPASLLSAGRCIGRSQRRPNRHVDVFQLPLNLLTLADGCNGSASFALPRSGAYCSGLSFGCLNSSFISSLSGRLRLMPFGGIGDRNHFLYSFSPSPEVWAAAIVSSTNFLNCVSPLRSIIP
jgi:hypothetical protein